MTYKKKYQKIIRKYGLSQLDAAKFFKSIYISIIKNNQVEVKY